MTIQYFQIASQWRSVLVEENGSGYEFPSKLTRFMHNKYNVPTVYQWRVHPGDQGKPEELYIGEAEDLARRIQRVLTPTRKEKKSDANARLRKELDGRRAIGKHVFLDCLDFAPFELNGILFERENMRDVFCRKAVENLCLYLAQSQRHPLLNRCVDPVEKVARELAKLPPHVLREALAQAQRTRLKENAETH